MQLYAHTKIFGMSNLSSLNKTKCPKNYFITSITNEIIYKSGRKAKLSGTLAKIFISHSKSYGVEYIIQTKRRD